jgi:hypothetical protein
MKRSSTTNGNVGDTWQERQKIVSHALKHHPSVSRDVGRPKQRWKNQDLLHNQGELVLTVINLTDHDEDDDDGDYIM